MSCNDNLCLSCYYQCRNIRTANVCNLYIKNSGYTVIYRDTRPNTNYEEQEEKE
jgi:hypothetical protein